MKNLNIPYLSQIDNAHDPFGSCNVTSIAMCLKYRGIVGDGSHSQLEDQVFHRSEEIKANRFTPMGVKRIIESYNRKCNTNTSGDLQFVRNSIDKNAPVIVHGYFTEPGHLIVIKGYDEKEEKFLVNDPFGEWYPWWYEKKSGENLKYSYRAIAACASAWDYNQAKNFYSSISFDPESAKEMWVHSVCP